MWRNPLKLFHHFRNEARLTMLSPYFFSILSMTLSTRPQLSPLFFCSSKISICAVLLSSSYLLQHIHAGSFTMIYCSPVQQIDVQIPGFVSLFLSQTAKRFEIFRPGRAARRPTQLAILKGITAGVDMFPGFIRKSSSGPA